MAALGVLTAGIAHEINNPVNFVTAGVGALEKKLAPVIELMDAIEAWHGTDHQPEGTAAALQTKIKSYAINEAKTVLLSLISNVKEGANRTTKIVRGLRTFSRHDEADSKFADIHEGLEATLIMLRNKLGSGIELATDFDLDLPMIECFPGQLNQLFMNLVSNAIDACYGQGNITITTRRAGQQVKITIADTGPGIPQEKLQNLFEPIYITKAPGAVNGLGLAISYSIIEKHKGSLTVQSTPGIGTTFTILLNLTQP